MKTPQVQEDAGHGLAPDDRSPAEDASALAGSRLDWLVSRSPAVLCAREAVGDCAITFLSANVRSLLGYEAAEFLSGAQFWREHVHPDDRARTQAQLAQLAQAGRGVLEYRLACRDGACRWLQETLSLARDESGAPRELVGCWLDCTEQKAAEEALCASEERFRSLVETQVEGAGLVDAEENFVFANRAAHEILGVPAGTLVGRNLREFLRPEQFDLVRAETAKRRAGQRSRYELTLVRPDGAEAIISITAFPKFDQQGAYLGAYAVFLDVTERKQMESLLHTERDLALALTKAQGLQDGLRLCLEAALRVSGLDCGGIYLRDEATGALDLACHQGLGAEFVESAAHYPPDSPNVRLVMAGGAVYGNYARLGLAPASGATRDSLKAIAIVPIPHEGRVVGCLNVASHKLEEAPAFAREALETIAAQIGSAVARLRAEAARQQAHEQLAATIKALPDLLFVIGRDGRIYECHAPYPEQLYTTPDRFLGRTVAQVLPAEPAGIVSEAIARAAAHGWHGGAVYALPMETGLRWYELSIAARGDHRAPDARFIALVRDITSRKRAEEKLQQAQKAWENIFQAIGHPTVVLDPAHRLLAANRAAVRAIGKSEAELRGRHCYEVFHGTAGPPDGCPLQSLLRSGAEGAVEMEMEALGGMFLVSCTPVFDERGQLERIIHIATDITQLKQAERALRESEALYVSLVENLPLKMFRKDKEGRFTYANHLFCASLGRSLDQIKGRSDGDFYPAQLAAKYHQDDAAVMAGGYGTVLIEAHQQPDGQQSYVQVWKTPLRNAQGAVVGLQGVFWDVTEQKLAEERIRQQANLLDLAQDAIMVRDLGDQVRFWNKGAERLYGWTAEEVLARKAPQVLCRDAAILAAAKRQVLERGEWNGELQQVTKSGAEVVVTSRWTLMRDAAGNPSSVLILNTDITETRRLEAHFLRARRLEAIGTLTSGIAHDLNNILTPIAMSAPMLRWGLSADEFESTVATIESSVQRAAEIVKQLLTFSRGQPDQRVAIQPGSLVRELLKMAQETFPRSLTISADLPPGLWPVAGDPTQIHQVLLNLCVNARDAMPDGGQLTLAAENVALDEAAARTRPGAQAGNYVVLRVTDTGCGISPEHLEQVFDPFFTTKPPGQGTGLGLSTVLGIVKGHGGFVNVRSQVGQGSCFEVCLPAAPAGEAPAPPAAPAGRAFGSGQIILVVDDEARIREMASQVLRKHGYEVLTAADGVEALDLFAAQRGKVRVVFTDLMMPRMSGVELIRAMRQLEPGIIFIATTGLQAAKKAATDGAAELKDLGVAVFLPKPFTPGALLAVVEQALQGPGQD